MVVTGESNSATIFREMMEGEEWSLAGCQRSNKKKYEDEEAPETQQRHRGK